MRSDSAETRASFAARSSALTISAAARAVRVAASSASVFARFASAAAVRTACSSASARRRSIAAARSAAEGACAEGRALSRGESVGESFGESTRSFLAPSFPAGFGAGKGDEEALSGDPGEAPAASLALISMSCFRLAAARASSASAAFASSSSFENVRDRCPPVGTPAFPFAPATDARIASRAFSTASATSSPSHHSSSDSRNGSPTISAAARCIAAFTAATSGNWSVGCVKRISGISNGYASLPSRRTSSLARYCFAPSCTIPGTSNWNTALECAGVYPRGACFSRGNDASSSLRAVRRISVAASSSTSPAPASASASNAAASASSRVGPSAAQRSSSARH